MRWYRFNETLAVFNGNTVPSEENAEQRSEEPETVTDVAEASVPPATEMEEASEEAPNSVLSLIEALSTWKGE